MAVDHDGPPSEDDLTPAVISRVEFPIFGGGRLVIETMSDQTVWVNGSKVEPAAPKARAPVRWATLNAFSTSEPRQAD